jgi:lysophospholipase L1-like esterase
MIFNPNWNLNSMTISKLHLNLMIVSGLVLLPLSSGDRLFASATLLTPTDRIVFIGDSITGQGSQPNGWIHLMEDALASVYTGPHPTLIGLGGSGSGINAWTGYEKTSRTQHLALDNPNVDVGATLDGKVDVIVIMLGVNDLLSPHITDKPADLIAWQNEYRDFIHALRTRSHPRIVALATPTMCTENPDSYKNKVVTAMVDKIKELAASENCILIPTNATFWSYLNEGRSYYPDYHLTRDGVHPNEAGHALFAATMLKGLGEQAAADAFLQKNAATILKKIPNTLSYRLRRLTTDERTGEETFELLYFNKTSSPAVKLVLPDGWKIVSDDGAGKFVVAGVPDRLTNKLILQAGQTETDIEIPAPWLVGTANLAYLGWTGSIFDPEKGKLPSDDVLSKGNGFATPYEISPGHTVLWKRYIANPDDSDDDPRAVINMASVTFYQNYDIAYGARWIHCDHDRPAVLQAGALGFAGYNFLAVWLNGAPLFSGEAVRGKVTSVPCQLKTGWNCLVFKSNHLEWQWILKLDFQNMANDDWNDVRIAAKPPVAAN